jgi:SAM-dependent methyltransferase
MNPSEWQAFIDRSRDKWREVPGTRQERVFSADLLALDDAALLAYWQRGRDETTVPEVRGWFQDLYRDRLAGLDVADVGPGLGIDGFFFASHGARVTFVDIVDDNLRLLDRLSRLKGVDVETCLAEDIFDIRLAHDIDVLLFVGSLHNAPFEISRREAASLTRWLRPGGLVLMLTRGNATTPLGPPVSRNSASGATATGRPGSSGTTTTRCGRSSAPASP